MNIEEIPLQEQPVIPDSIEPYRGYKALNIMDGGILCSPSYAAHWPPGKAYEAVCGGTQEWGWVPVAGEPRSMDDSVVVPHRGAMFATSTVASSSFGSARAPTPRLKPNNPLPPGWNWSWEMFGHDVPDPDCHCGVYVAEEPKQCIQYMGRANGIICEIALWGRVIPAHSGARGQFAYPQRILAPRALVRSVQETALLYNIPILVLDPVESEHLCTDPGCDCGETCCITGKARKSAPALVSATPPMLLQINASDSINETVARLLQKLGRQP